MLRHADASPKALEQPVDTPPIRYDLQENVAGFTTSVFEAPVPARVLDMVQPLWRETFGNSFDRERHVLEGGCVEYTRDLLYVATNGGEVAGTAVITMGRGMQGAAALGGVGEVATAQKHRGRGIAATLVMLGRDDFTRLGGELLGLGTVNPAAARVYRKLGFSRLGGCDAWYCNCRDARAPEEYLVDYFRAARAAGPPRYINGSGSAWPCSVAEGTAGERVSAMSLVHWVGSSDDLLLDANLGLFTPRMETITSAMGVYDRYEGLRGDPLYQDGGEAGAKGTWLAAHSPDGQLVGLATCVADGATDGEGEGPTCWVDVFLHRSFLNEWGALLGGATSWAMSERRFSRVAVRVAQEDDSKQQVANCRTPLQHHPTMTCSRGFVLSDCLCVVSQRFIRHGFRPAAVDPEAEAAALILQHSVGGEDRVVELMVLEMMLGAADGAAADRRPQQPGLAAL